MLYSIKYQDSSGFVYAVPASVPEADKHPLVTLYSEVKLEPNYTYSFYPHKKWIGSTPVEGELDYKNPGRRELYGKHFH